MRKNKESLLYKVCQPKSQISQNKYTNIKNVINNYWLQDPILLMKRSRNRLL